MRVGFHYRKRKCAGIPRIEGGSFKPKYDGSLANYYPPANALARGVMGDLEKTITDSNGDGVLRRAIKRKDTEEE